MESHEDLLARHSRERKDLQSRITQKKKSASKKTRKGVISECDSLEAALKEQQERDLAAGHGEHAIPNIEDLPELENDIPSSSSPAPANTADRLDVDSKDDNVSDTTSTIGEPKKRNRQKERLARRAAEQEAEQIAAQQEAASQPNYKSQERAGMLKTFKEHGLTEMEIRPDGHCMFSAVADQLDQAGVSVGVGNKQDAYKAIRKRAADYIESHQGDFEGFLEEPLPLHVHKIRDTAEWGGHVELIALARSYGVEICVIQDSRIDRFEPEAKMNLPTQKIWLAYYLHGYGLGEHYNSLRKTP